MSVKLTVVYGNPDDAETFDKHYNEVHMPMVGRWPGVERTEVAKVTGGPMGSPASYHLITEIYFADEDALNAALSSDAGREAGKDFMAIAPPGSFMTVAQIVN
ncbi:MAG TPA: EthD family reductase [Mycobacteriales bacterium]|jgi:uncharacterized protein (TIGR02118 family)|nr:EthD family reductase [Mycobacteriales bacterium]